MVKTQACETSKIQCRIVIPRVLDENLEISFLEFKLTWTANSKWYLINNKEINILTFQMTLDKVYQPSGCSLLTSRMQLFDYL